MAPVSLDDIMEFMKKEKEDRAKEREMDKEEIRQMIADGVKDEVRRSVKPLETRQESLEKTQSEMKDQFKDVLVQVKEMKTLLNTSKISSDKTSYWPGLPAPEITPGLDQTPVSSEKEASTHHSDPKVAEIIDIARRTVGLHKIDSSDLARMRLAQYGGATCEEEEKLLAVKEYLVCELKIAVDDVENMKIESIFIPAKDASLPQSLNVTFKDHSSISKIYERTRIMRKESRVTNYFPRQFKDRLRAVSEFDYNLRQDKRYQTRIKMGLLDLELHRKLRGSKKWERISLPTNLPPVDMSSKPSEQVSDSPPPGRPGSEGTRGKRGRGSDSSSDEGQNSTKVKKISDTETQPGVDKETEWLENLKKADLVSEEPTINGDEQRDDPGNFTSIQSTPAKQLLSQVYSQSPILTRSGKNLLK